MPFFRDTEGLDAPAKDASPLLHGSVGNTMKRMKRFFGAFFVPLSIRDFRLLFGGQLISTLGDMFYAVAMPWFILSSGGGVQTLSLVLVAYGIPRAASPLLGGLLSDRLRPQRVMLLSDSMRALLTGVLAWLAYVGHPALWLLCLIMVLLGTFTGLFLPASFAMIPDLLPEADLQAGNSLSATSAQLAILVGPALAGLLVSWLQPAVGLGLDALSFVVSAITLALMWNTRSQESAAHSVGVEKLGSQAEEEASLSNASASTLTFWQLLRSSRLLQIVLVIVVVGNFFGGGIGSVALPVFAHDLLKAGAGGYGVIIGAFGIGALIGGVAASGMGNLPRRGVIILLIWLLQAVAITAIPFMGIAFGVVGSALASAVEGATNSLGNITFRTIMQQRFPRNLLGRINGAFFFCEFSLYPLSVALSGQIAVHWGILSVFLIGGVIGLMSNVYGLAHREMREM